VESDDVPPMLQVWQAIERVLQEEEENTTTAASANNLHHNHEEEEEGLGGGGGHIFAGLRVSLRPHSLDEMEGDAEDSRATPTFAQLVAPGQSPGRGGQLLPNPHFPVISLKVGSYAALLHTVHITVCILTYSLDSLTVFDIHRERVSELGLYSGGIF
jgi:hypothetical protein